MYAKVIKHINKTYGNKLINNNIENISYFLYNPFYYFSV